MADRRIDLNFDRKREARDSPRSMAAPDANFLSSINGEQPNLPAPGLPDNYRALGPDLHLDAVRRAGGTRPTFAISEQTRNNKGSEGA